MPQNSDVLKSVVFFRIILQQEGVAVTHIIPHSQIIPCLEIGVILILAVPTFGLDREIKDAKVVIYFADSFVQAKLPREG